MNGRNLNITKPTFDRMSATRVFADAPPVPIDNLW
jgi:hypothetical protein